MNYSFADAINQLKNGKACKRPSWRGYVKRMDVGTDGAYNIVFVKPNGTTTYTYSVTSDGVWSTTDTLVMDVDLFVGMCSTDWLVGATDDFESARSGTGNW